MSYNNILETLEEHLSTRECRLVQASYDEIDYADDESQRRLSSGIGIESEISRASPSDRGIGIDV